MPAPTLTPDEILSFVPNVTDIVFLSSGGQKSVYACRIGGQRYALKLLIAPRDEPDEAREATERASREVATLRECDTPFLVKLGPLDLTYVEFNDIPYLYFTEELIEGRDLRAVLNSTTLNITDVARLGFEISTAVRCLWDVKKIHRDIKPENIMQRAMDGSFVLLDVGIVFDFNKSSVTATNRIPGTPEYLSPERLDLSRKRQIDFRSDLFSLGIVMYESLAERHPFTTGPYNQDIVLANIATLNPPPPSTIRGNIADSLDAIIMRLLEKQPYLRFRSVEMFQVELQETGLLGGGL